MILKTQQRFKNESHNVFTEEIIRLRQVQRITKELNQLIQ